MTDFSTFFPGEATLLLRRFFPDPGSFNLAVPAGATIARISAEGCGGQGDNYGGGGAFVRSVVSVTAAENLRIQVGNTSTQSVSGDSFVKRNDNTTVLAYADRGRGNGQAGLASRSIGDIKRDGQNGLSSGGQYGTPAWDAGDFGALGFQGQGVYRLVGGVTTNDALTGPGGGGHLTPYFDSNGVFLINFASGAAAGAGQVAIEFFDINPGY